MTLTITIITIAAVTYTTALISSRGRSIAEMGHTLSEQDKRAGYHHQAIIEGDHLRAQNIQSSWAHYCVINDRPVTDLSSC